MSESSPSDQPESSQAAAVPQGEEAIEWRLASPTGEQYGPTVPTLFAQWITQGRVPHDWLVWRTGWPEWRVAAEVVSELPAPLPPPGSSDTPPPLPADSALKITKPKPNQSVAATPKEKYAQRKKRNAQRQKIVIGILGLVTIVLIVLLAYMTRGG